MRIVVNLLPTLKAKTGVGHYAARLFAALHGELRPDALHGFPDGRLAETVRTLHRRGGGSIGSGHRSVILGAMSATAKGVLRAVGRGYLGWAFRAACRRQAYDLYHEPNFIPFHSRIPTVVTVHDLSVILHPEWHPADRVRHHERRFRDGLAAAHHVITVSNFVRRQVIKHLGVAARRVTAVPNGVGPEYFAAGAADAQQARQALRLPPTYLLGVGTIEPRKNVLTLLRAYCALSEDLRRRCPLVLAGGWGWKSADIADYFRCDAAGKGVMHLGYTDDSLLPGLYAGARALVFPSYYEGFGLPPLEMLACGGTVLASNAEAVSEVLGRHAHYVDARDVDGWRDALTRAIVDDDWLAELRHGGREHARHFSWERCARETAAVYRSIVRPVPLAA
jgi:alpha-1,3-rhamnosyl/mannosyltransferase